MSYLQNIHLPHEYPSGGQPSPPEEKPTKQKRPDGIAPPGRASFG